MRTFFQELKRRRVYRVALAYVIGASATVQVVGTVLPAFHAPDWVMQVFLLLIALGFPLALVLAWVFDISKRGLRKTPAAGAAPSSDYRRLAILGFVGLLLAAVALYACRVWYPWPSAGHAPSLTDLSVTGTQPTPAISEKSIAVLPFENLSDEKENGYFVDGIQDEILTDLSKVSDLKVISRTSVMQYRSGSRPNLREIGKELGVAYVLEGAAQRDGNRVRVSAQLIDARTDNHLWAQHYDRDLNDLFALQSEVAEMIVAQLQSKISPAEKAAIEEQPTANAVAHEFYLRANALISAPLFNAQGAEKLFEAIVLLNQAVAEDPDYFLAYCRLASAHDQIYLNGPDQTPARRDLAEQAVHTAQRLRPDAGETHLALAEHLYCGFLAYDDARQELAIARRSLPNEPLIFQLAGFIDRRQGRWDASTRNLVHALELDPRNTYTLQQIAVSYLLLRQFHDAAHALDRAQQILPNESSLEVARAGLALQQRADPEPLRATIDRIVTQNPSAAPGLADEWFSLALCQHNAATADLALAAMSPQGYNNEGIRFPLSWCEALAARLRGDALAARTSFVAARDEIEQDLRDSPDDASALCVLGMIDAALDQKKQAIEEGRRAVALLPISKDAINGPLVSEYLAVTYAWAGKKEAALDQLRAVVQVPSDVSYGQLRLHPFWDSLRGDPRFEALITSLAPPATPPP